MKKRTTRLVPFATLAALAIGVPATLHAETPSSPPAAVSVPSVGLSPVSVHKRLRVAVYKGAGAGDDSRKTLIAALSKDACLATTDLTTEDILAGKLSGFDVLVQPGGSGGGQGRALGEKGRDLIKAFVRGGGGYMGVCGGAYLASCDYPWSLHILNARVIDKAHWARGHGPVAVAPTADGKTLLGAGTDRLSIIYWQGPLLAPAHEAGLPAYDELAKFEGEIADKGAPHGVMQGTTAVASGTYGEGRVLCFSPHPEKTVGQESLLHHAILWVSKVPVTPTASTTAAK